MPHDDVRKKSKKRDHILQAAERLFLQKGLRAVTIEQIVREAGVSKATLYNHFPDKRQIAESVLDHIADSVLQNLEQIVEQGKRGRLTQELFLSLFDMNRYDHFLQSGFGMELLQDYPDTMRSYSERWAGRILPVFRELIRMAKIDGIVRMDVDPDVLIVYTLSVKRAFQDNPHVPANMSLKDFSQKFYDLYLNGVMEKDGRRPEEV
ncbi:TetR/AcrR family transcriptional regulator [Paenibacillus sp. GYB003]|uniref:TetR/AcrR family transcriptional regulator n=1 Tax=Paenibacillus sp. GYB003 TaxID=2994392 RepID=UPI002F967671